MTDQTTTPDGNAAVEAHDLEAGDRVPNNPSLPLLVYRGVLADAADRAEAFERAFARNGWGNGWRDGIYGWHHFHTTAHEALGIAAGRARVCFGGPDGLVAEVAAGDLIVVPAGVGHKKLDSSDDFLVIGAYPGGQEPDMNRDDRRVDTDMLAQIGAVALPDADPLFGTDGPLVRLWQR